MTQAGKTLRLMLPVDIPVSALTVVAAPPDLVTQANVEAVTGFSRGVYLADLVPSYEAAGGRVARVGKTRAVERVAFVAWLMGHRAPAAEPAAEVSEEVSEDDRFAAEFGLFPVKPGARVRPAAGGAKGGAAKAMKGGDER